jgi:hypothetical protein
MAELKVVEGRKISPEEAKTLDRSKMTVAITGAGPEVEGQAIHNCYTMCPWCGAVLRTCDDKREDYHWITCGSCGRPFQA